MNNKKVCIITTVHPPFDTRIFIKQAKSLVNAKYDVTLITTYDKEEIIDGIKIIPLPKPKNRFERIFINSLKAFKLALKQKADIYHFHDPELLFIGFLLKLFTKRPVIFDMHENIVKSINDKYYLPNIFKFPLLLYYSVMLMLAERLLIIILAEDSYQKSFKKNLLVIHNFGIPQKLNQNLLINNTHQLIYAGGVEKVRGIKEMLLAFSNIANDFNVKLKIIGNCSDKNFEKELIEIINSKKLNDKVIFTGRISNNKVLEEIEKSIIGFSILHPIDNYLESYPTKIFEYMSLKVPIIASDFPLYKTIVEGNNCGFNVDPFNIEKISEIIKILLSNPDKTREYGENGHKAFIEKYNWENESIKLLELYNQLLKGK